MLENPNDSSSSSSSATVKRYAPPNQRNRSLSKRKSGGSGSGSGDKFEKMTNVYGNEAERNPGATSRHVPSEYQNAVGSNFANHSSHHRLIPLQGCLRSEAPQILNDRWKAAINAVNDPLVDVADRPVLYTGTSSSAWGSFRLPHQMISPANNIGSSGAQKDFLGELRKAIRDANTSANL